MDILNQRKMLFRLVVALTLLNLGLIGFFGWKHFTRNHKKEGKEINTAGLAALLKKELGLSSTQADSLVTIRSAFFEQEKTLSETTRAKRDSMNQLMFTAGNNDSVLRSLAGRVAENEYRMELLRIQQASQLRAICNSDQLKKLERLVKEVRDYLKPDEKKEEKEK